MTEQQKRQLYESIMKQIAPVVKRTINEMFENDNNFKPNRQLIERFINTPRTKLLQTREKNIRSMQKSFISEADTNDLEPIVNDIESGQSAFGKHHYKERRTIDYPESTKDMILASANRFADVYYMYNFDDWQFMVVGNDDVYYMDLLLPNDKNGLDKFLTELRTKGYHYKKSDTPLKQYFKENGIHSGLDSDICNSWTYIRIFEKTDSNQRERIRKISQYLCHYTLRSNEEDIKKSGIIANNLSHSDYPRRIFMIIDNRNDIIDKINSTNVLDYEHQKDGLINRLIQYRRDEGYRVSRNDFIEIVIDIDKLPDDVELAFDQNCYPYAVYTKSNIPAEAIVGIKNI